MLEVAGRAKLRETGQSTAVLAAPHLRPHRMGGKPSVTLDSRVARGSRSATEAGRSRAPTRAAGPVPIRSSVDVVSREFDVVVGERRTRVSPATAGDAGGTPVLFFDTRHRLHEVGPRPTPQASPRISCLRLPCSCASRSIDDLYVREAVDHSDVTSASNPLLPKRLSATPTGLAIHARTHRSPPPKADRARVDPVEYEFGHDDNRYSGGLTHSVSRWCISPICPIP
jgi:hypothetical protein